MTHPSPDQPGGPVQAPAGPGIAVQEYRSAPEMQAEMARLSLYGWHVVGIANRRERRGSAAATVLLFIVGWFVLFLTWPLMFWTWPRSSDRLVITYATGPANRDPRMGRRRVPRKARASPGAGGPPSVAGGGWGGVPGSINLATAIPDEEATAVDDHEPSSSVAEPRLPRKGELLRWRKATWANIIWNGLMAWLLVGGLLNTQIDERYGAFSIIATAIAVWGLLVIWFIGSIMLAAVWLVSQPKRNTAVYGPQGHQMMVAETEAQR